MEDGVLVRRWRSGYRWYLEPLPESWLNQQSQYDLWVTKKYLRQLKVEQLYEAA